MVVCIPGPFTDLLIRTYLGLFQRCILLLGVLACLASLGLLTRTRTVLATTLEYGLVRVAYHLLFIYLLVYLSTCTQTHLCSISPKYDATEESEALARSRL